ncbi:MAG: hypothetical protein U0894_18605 [Pirellulales bacterium]
MSMIAMTKVTYFKAFFNERERGVSLSREELSRLFEIKPEDTQWQVQTCTGMAGQVDAAIEDWGHCKKVHFTCTGCGNHQWADPSNLLSGRELWYSECRCVELWLVSWPMPQAAKN